MSDPRTECQRLIRRAASLPYGDERLAVVDEAAALADRAGDPELAFGAREAILDAAAYGGHPERTLTTMAWLLAQVDADPVRFPAQRILWKYKWALAVLPGFETISRERIEAAVEDFARRTAIAGAGVGATAKLRTSIALATGRPEEALGSLFAWQAVPRDWLSDCRACDANLAVEVHVGAGDDVAALRAAEPVLAGRLRCAEVPHYTYGEVLMPLVRLGRLDEAAGYQQRGYPLVRSSEEFLEAVALHLEYVAHVGDISRAASLLDRHMAWALRTRSGLRRLRFMLAARSALGLLATHPDHLVRVPAGLIDGIDVRMSVPAADAIAAVDAHLDRLVPAFDTRNGNDWFARRRAAVSG